jgi:hypothetical protein
VNEAHDGVSEFLSAVGVDVHEVDAQLGCSSGIGTDAEQQLPGLEPVLRGTVPQSGGQLNRKLTEFNGNGNQGDAYIFQWQ